MMGLALVSIGSFVLGLLVAAAALHWFFHYVKQRNKVGALVGGFVRGMTYHGLEWIDVPIIELQGVRLQSVKRGLIEKPFARVELMALADAIESCLTRTDGDGGGGIPRELDVEPEDDGPEPDDGERVAA